ncbi:hypothetical protein NLJ89_g4455 [Agrocybe chaxingu]|uniref:Uncharacterized protein n=1 Tax=Agrocybe chaxingu TaxID=84603 RepID=A0A9W8K2S8_9AGAR|nr:hypothetical protein NLJ89_g4455 [Agrocybe chaxingu]
MQHSTSPNPFMWAKTAGPNSYRDTEELLAWAEVWAYQKLTHLQGTKIPRLHGAFQVKSPVIGDSQPHLALLMSYVGGVTILERCVELGSVSDNGDTRWCSLVRDLFKQVHEFHQLGLCNLDICEANVKAVTSPDGSDSLVFFDFATARPSMFANELEKEQHEVHRALVNDLAHLRGLLLTICGDVPGWDDGPRPLFKRRWEFLQWARKEHAGDAWLKEWGSEFDCWKVD